MKNKELTARQKEILSLLRRGLTNNEICKALCISTNTVKVHLANIYKILEVTNRTEAVSTDIQEGSAIPAVESKNVVLVINRKSDFSQYTLSNRLCISIIEALHCHQIFRIQENESEDQAPGYKIDFTITNTKCETLSISLKLGKTSEIIWTMSQHLNDNDDIQLIGIQYALKLFRQMVITTATMDYTPQCQIPYWWYASCYSNIKMETRSKENFGRCEAKLKPVVYGESYNNYAAYQLAIVYYLSVLDACENAPACMTKLGDLTRRSMRDAPYSIYSQLMMAFYNILIGSKNEAIAYLQQVLVENPQEIMARTILPQVYLLVGQEEKALQILNENERLIPEQATSSGEINAKMFIYFLQGKYDNSKELSSQILLFRPESVYARLIAIASCLKKNERDEAEKNIQKLFEYNPNFSQKDIENLLAGISSPKKSVFSECLQVIFSKKIIH